MKSSGNSVYSHAFLQSSTSGVQHENVQLSRAMQMAQDAPKFLSNLLTVSAEDMMHMRKAWESKNIFYKGKTQSIICNFPTEIQFLWLYRPHTEYEKKESLPV